jgi:hypothetical protein
MNNLGTTISISHILQATAWLQSQLPRLGEYLNFSKIELLHNPQEISFQILKTIHDFITQEWNSTETTSEKLLGVDVSISRDEAKKIIKSAGSALNTLMSLYEFLFNNDSRANKETLSIVGIQHEQGEYAPKFNIIADITGQMIATAAPALIEHNPDGTIWDSENESSPISTNYIQKALRNKSMFSFRSFLRSKFLMEVLSGNSEFAQILATTTGERNTLAGCLTRNDFKNAIGSIFGIDPDHRQNSTSAINALRELLIGAESELLTLNKATLHTLFNRMGNKIIDL